MKNNDSRKKRIVCLIFSLLSVTACFFLLSLTLASVLHANTSSPPAAPETAEYVQASQFESKYVVASYKNKVAVYSNGSIEPTEVFDIYISSLPEADRDLLVKGIEVDSDDELYKMIEDFTS